MIGQIVVLLQLLLLLVVINRLVIKLVDKSERYFLKGQIKKEKVVENIREKLSQ